MEHPGRVLLIPQRQPHCEADVCNVVAPDWVSLHLACLCGARRASCVATDACMRGRVRPARLPASSLKGKSGVATSADATAWKARSEGPKHETRTAEAAAARAAGAGPGAAGSGGGGGGQPLPPAIIAECTREHKFYYVRLRRVTFCHGAVGFM